MIADGLLAEPASPILGDCPNHPRLWRLRVIGQRSRLKPDIVRLIDDAETRTADNRKLNLTVALSYGGRAEIAEAARRIAGEVRAGHIEPAEIDEALAQKEKEILQV